MKQPISILTSPAAPAPFFPDGEPVEQGCNAVLLENAHQTIIKSYPKMHSFLIVRDGKLIFEKYYGAHHQGALNDLRSATKSFTSTLFGMAVHRGELPSIDTPVLPFLKEYATRSTHPLLHRVTFRHLLTMTSGFAWQTGKKLGEPLIHRFHRNRRWASFALALPVIDEDMGTFQYRSTDSHLLSVALSKATGMDAFTYAKTHLFTPLDITHSAWTPSPEGHSMGHVGLYLTSRDMAKFGQCCLNEGKWKGEQIIPKEWLTEALTPKTEGYPAFGDYGFQWWTGKMDGQPFTLAHGHGGQQIYIFPELNTVIVFTQDSHVSRWKNPRMLLERFIIKSFNT
ncbi:serine hydrolase domain-containing protein [Paenibacillus dakarensis]|uniref:serine hydrolase domain-containing protein n=1 Tax=Paenibacillus dakarensis TaxID=1527293 RepID=UPI0006D5B635|nr:serine hydrolase [Paenibacillus dakarensis]